MARPPKSLLKDSHPDIAAEVVNQSLLPTLATGADRKIKFRCPEGHIYEARPYNRTNKKTGGTGCPVCNGKQILVGFNDLATTQPAVAAICTDPKDALTHTQFSNKKISFTCPQGHTWTAPIARIVEQSLDSPHLGCPYCSGRKSVRGKNDLATTHPELAKQLVDQSLAHTLKAGSNKEVEWQCEHGHVWITNPYNRITYDNNCPYCSNHRVQPGITDLATTHPDIAQELADQSLATQYTAGSETTVEWRCNNGFDHTYKTTIHNRVQDKSHCSICNGKTVLPGFNDMATTNPDMATRLLDPSDAQRFTQSSGKAVMWRCLQDPTHTWENSPWKEGSNLLGLCPDCRPPSNAVSLMEQDIARVISTLVGEEHVTTSRRDLLGKSRYELDIVIEHLKLAFEFNGLYWHCEINKPEPDYHAAKSMMAQKHGYQLIHIWEDDYLNRFETVVMMIASKLGKTEQLQTVLPNIDPKATQRIGARELTFTQLTPHDAHAFLERNHIQGAAYATYHFGLVDADGDIRAVLSTRSWENIAHNTYEPGTWELQRFATLGIVQGGFSKLLQHAEAYLKKHEYITNWITYSANDVSTGDTYANNGFVVDKYCDPDYKYVGNDTKWVRKHRRQYNIQTFKTRPDLFWDDNWTEHEAALKNKIFRIYDAGKIRWKRTVP